MARRTVREAQESLTKKVPRGPLGFFGKGNAVGAIGFGTLEVIRGLAPVSELEPGYKVIGSSFDEVNGIERNTFKINAFSRDVARFVAKVKSSPSNIDFLIREVEVVSVTPIKERSTATTWEVVTETEVRDAAKSVEGK